MNLIKKFILQTLKQRDESVRNLKILGMGICETHLIPSNLHILQMDGYVSYYSVVGIFGESRRYYITFKGLWLDHISF